MVTQEQGVAEAATRRERLAKVERAVEAWVGQLIDLTARNQLLSYRTLKRGTLELTEADPDPLDAVLSGRKVRLATLFRPTRIPSDLSMPRCVHGRSTARPWNTSRSAASTPCSSLTGWRPGRRRPARARRAHPCCCGRCGSHLAGRPGTTSTSNSMGTGQSTRPCCTCCRPSSPCASTPKTS